MSNNARGWLTIAVILLLAIACWAILLAVGWLVIEVLWGWS